ncbi:MAG TPA: adenylate/guanylate cyclase domain-containing protein [Verrucomicrobiae bacterium]
MKLKRPKLTPLLIALAVLALVSGVRALHLDFPERLERMTYDLRVRAACQFPAPVATNLAFVAIDESSIKAVKSGKFGYRFGLLWPRQVYGRLVDELSAQGVEAAGFDVLFGELRTDQFPVQLVGGGLEESDDFFADQLRRAGNIILATTPELTPPPLFATNALTLGDISSKPDTDGILRRVKPFCDVRHWHPLIQQIADNPELAVNLTNAIFVPGKIILPQTGLANSIEIPVDAENNFTLADFGVDKLPPGVAPTAKAFTTERIWHMGIQLAAQELKLDLAKSIVDLPGGKIILRGANGIERVIPVDADGYFLVNWQLTPNDPRLMRLPVEDLLAQDHQRLLGQTNDLRADLRGKLVIVGSATQGINLTDRGATPLDHDTLLVSKYWNIASSVITGQFIRRAGTSETNAIIILLGLLTAVLTWELRAFTASVATFFLVAGYTAFTFFAFIHFRLWLPLIFPVVGAMLVEHISLVTYRVVFEEREQRRVKSVFSKIVSPDVVNELLGAEKLSLGGARREVTVFFADVRGFTTFTDQLQEDVAEYVRTNNVDLATAEKYFEESARETLEIVNLYLAAVADAVKDHNGTLDKYIGDCVMAFWNAPTPNARHAKAAVEAAIAAQRAIHHLNAERLAQNVARELDNRARIAVGQPPKPLHVALQLGTGINTGTVTVGLMGSNQHILNYTVFGREVNLASRLEGVSGSGRIIISDTTYNQLLRHAPALAATCTELFPVQVKGIKNAVRIYEVAWK